MSPETGLWTTAISEKTYHRCLSMSCNGEALMCCFVGHVVKSPAANLFEKALGWAAHSISAGLGESRSRRHAETLSIKTSLELSWQWRIFVFRCSAQMGDSQALSLIWTVRDFLFDQMLTILVSIWYDHNYFQNHSSLLSLDGPQPSQFSRHHPAPGLLLSLGNDYFI